MNWIGRLSALGCLALLANHAVAQSRWVESPRYQSQPCCPTPGTQLMPGTPGTPSTTPNIPPPVPNPETAGAGLGDAFAQAPEGGTQPTGSYNPGMFGDLIGLQARRVVFLPSGASTGMTPGIHGNRIAVLAPVPFHAAFKITENESPRPTDRVFINYNYYNDVTRQISGISPSDLHRETIGFEKTMLDGNASFGIRLPFQQLVGDSAVDDSQVGDVSLIFKYAMINDPSSRDVLSGGMVLTLPTGKAVQIDGESSLHATVFQQYVGFILNADDWYVQGFSSLAVPTDFRDVTLFFNSIGAGFWLYRDDAQNASLRGVVPTAELHLNTPLNHRGLNNADPIGYSDSLDATFGAHFVFRRVTAGVAIGTPLMGPRPYDVEALANLNILW